MVDSDGRLGRRTRPNSSCMVVTSVMGEEETSVRAGEENSVVGAVRWEEDGPGSALLCASPPSVLPTLSSN
jgi:hypothetical protein